MFLETIQTLECELIPTPSIDRQRYPEPENQCFWSFYVYQVSLVGE